jgi:hypothetical protein
VRKGQNLHASGSFNLPNDAVISLTKLLGHNEPRINDKLLVETLEHFASCKVRHGGDGTTMGKGIRTTTSNLRDLAEKTG